jgi:hypothetical protein
MSKYEGIYSRAMAARRRPRVPPAAPMRAAAVGAAKPLEVEEEEAFPEALKAARG